DAPMFVFLLFFFFFQAEDGIRDGHVTGVQTCALPICDADDGGQRTDGDRDRRGAERRPEDRGEAHGEDEEGEGEQRVGEAGHDRSEERRVGKECRSRWSPDHEKKKKRKRVSSIKDMSK